MGVFLKTEEERIKEQAEKEKKLLESKRLDFDKYNDETLRQNLIQSIKDVNSRMAGTGLYEWGSLLSGNSDVSMIMSLLKAQIDQNWILINQNEQILRELKKIDTNNEIVSNRKHIDGHNKTSQQISDKTQVADKIKRREHTKRQN